MIAMTCPCGGQYTTDDTLIEAGGFWVVMPDVKPLHCNRCGLTPEEASRTEDEFDMLKQLNAMVASKQMKKFNQWLASEVVDARDKWKARTGNPDHDKRHTVTDWLVIANKFMGKAVFESAFQNGGYEEERDRAMRRAVAMLFEAWQRVYYLPEDQV